MKKFITALLLVMLFAGISSAEVVGIISKANSSQENFTEKVALRNDSSHITLAALFAEGVSERSYRFYDSFSLLQLALSKGDVDSIVLPELVGEYMLKHSDQYNLHGYIITKFPLNLAFGFTEEKAALRDKFNEAITAMLNDGTLGLIVKDYLTGPNADNPPAIKLEHFDDAETINAAITGDIPPIDYVAADGTPAGYNAAFLAELGRRLHVNINFLNVDTGARVAALKSGRADVVFWFEIDSDRGALDSPEGIILSVPYYGWNKILFIGKK